MQTTLENNRTKLHNKISSNFWEIAIFVGVGLYVFSRTLYITWHYQMDGLKSFDG